MNGYRITSHQLRQAFFTFFADRGHARIPATSIVPEHDPTALFITAGMQPLVPYLLGETHPAGQRLMNVQKCFRTDDIDRVGNATHLTFFEMLGNWSLGNYFKEEMIPWSWEFLTHKQWLGINPERLYVTVFQGDSEIAKDELSIRLWQEQFAQAGIHAQEGERILPLSHEDNWWGPVGQTGPCGPDTEMFFDTYQPPCSPPCQPGCNCGKYVEIWNNVFMEFNKLADGSYERLTQKNVDTGMGMARTLAALNGLDSVFEIDTLKPLVEKVTSLSGIDIQQRMESIRIVADHVNAIFLIMSDDVLPSNIEQGYVLRRLIRRVIRHGRRLKMERNFWAGLFPIVQETYSDMYPVLSEKGAQILDDLEQEEIQFEKTLEKGLQKFELLAIQLQNRSVINGAHAFDLFATYGFPLEMTQELAQERNLKVDVEGFQREFQRHQERSRQGAQQKFSGGLADGSAMATRYHTATHLLHAALRRVLGPHVEQRGSNITSERLRFDFSHPDKMRSEDLESVEDLVNVAISLDYPVHYEEMSIDEARQEGAIGLFEEKYDANVKVFTIGNPTYRPETDPTKPIFSKEICGGPHIERTGLLGKFKIVKEQSASRGIRRIRAVLE
jgi:alanyl-tRNA synthetase